MSDIRQCSIEHGLAVHLFSVGDVSATALEPWIALSRECGGFQIRVPGEDDLPEALRRWMLCFRELHALEFDAPAAATEIRLEAVHPSGRGEVTVPVDAVRSQP
jgi:hypothetical protein